MATIALINPFPNDVRTAFEAYISSTTYYNREQLPYEKWDQMRTILYDLTAFKLTDKESMNLKHRAQFDFELINNKLYRQKDIWHPNARYAVLKSEVFDIIAQEHLKLLHASCNKVWPTIK
jgi:hypothetical protein